MTTPPETPPAALKLPPRLLRELVGLALLVVGVLVLVVCGWHVSPWLAAAMLGGIFVCGGLALMTAFNAAGEG